MATDYRPMRQIAGLAVVAVLTLLGVAHGWWQQTKVEPRMEARRDAEKEAWPASSNAPEPGRGSFYWNTLESEDKTIQETRWKLKPGCGCATDDPDLPAELRTLQVTPTAPEFAQDEPISLRYDASYLCNGQTARDLEGEELGKLSQSAGTVRWTSMGEQNVPRLSGWVHFSGYHERGTYKIPIEIKVQCYNPSPECKQPKHFSVCSLKAKVPIKVVKRKKAASN